MDMFVIAGTDNFVCQKCHRILPLRSGSHKRKCKCGQRWATRPCYGHPVAVLAIEQGIPVLQTGLNIDYWSGYLVKAIN